MVGLAQGTDACPLKVLALLVALLLVATTAWAPTGGRSASVGAVGKTRDGCNCHNVTEALSVTPLLKGLPGRYEPGRVYRLNVSLEGGPVVVGGGTAGFDLSVSAGELLPPRDSGTVRVDPSTGDATHTTEGTNASWWHVRWRAPEEDTGEVTVALVVLAGNGDGSQVPGDQWARGEHVVEEGQRGGIRQAPAFWTVVGVAAVLALLGLVYYASRGPRLELRR